MKESKKEDHSAGKEQEPRQTKWMTETQNTSDAKSWLCKVANSIHEAAVISKRAVAAEKQIAKHSAISLQLNWRAALRVPPR